MANRILPKWATTVTPFSKYLAMVLFILLPFIGFYLSIRYQQQIGQSGQAVTTVSPTQISMQLLMQSPTKLIISFNRSPQTVIITDEKRVKQLYNEINALPIMPPGTYNCPKDNGTTYILDFYNKSILLLQAVVDPTGCRTVRLGNGKTKWALGVKGTAFINDLQQTFQNAIPIPRPTLTSFRPVN